MKFATLKDGSRDGQLIIVSRDLKTAVIASNIAPTLQDVLDSWDFMAPQCEDLYVQLNHGRAPYSFDFNPRNCMAPLPRAFQYVESHAYIGYLQTLYSAHNLDMPEIHKSEPLQYQLASDHFLGGSDEIVLRSESECLDPQAQLAVVTGDVAQGANPDNSAEQIRLVLLANGVSSGLATRTEAVGHHDLFSPHYLTSFAPVAVTVDELGDAWRDAQAHLPLRTSLNGKNISHPDAGIGMTFNFAQLVAHLAKKRALSAGTIISAGPIFNGDAQKSGGGIVAARASGNIADSGAGPYVGINDVVKIEVLDKSGKSVFGAIEQKFTQKVE